MATNPIIRLTNKASLSGMNAFARNCAKPVKAFLGIPYAEPPERFAPPKPLFQLWNGTKAATKLGAICPQNIENLRSTYSPFQIPDTMSEDCLHLNVWTPSLDSSSRLPVMVWIYGGYYTSGFLATGDDEVPGNMGLLDQREALRWIQKYIRYFGGDPENVTLFGESAGAQSVTWHLLTQQSRGLFHRVILQSGLSNVQNVKEAVQQLREMPLSDLVNNGPHLLFSPVVDGAELTDHPLTLFKNGQFAKVDVLLGFNSNEGFLTINELLKQKPGPITVERAREMLHAIVFRRWFSNLPSAQKIYDVIWNAYLKDVADPEILCKRLVEAAGDILFISPTIHLAHLHSKFGRGCKTFLYQFDHRPSFAPGPDWATASHGHEIPYVIGEPFLDRLPDFWSEDEQRLSAMLMTMWSNFARTGEASTVGKDFDFYWPPYNDTDRQHAILKPSPLIGQNYSRHLMDLHQNFIGNLVETDRRLNSNL